jgi:hypothetical protein
MLDRAHVARVRRLSKRALWAAISLSDGMERKATPEAGQSLIVNQEHHAS